MHLSVQFILKINIIISQSKLTTTSIIFTIFYENLVMSHFSDDIIRVLIHLLNNFSIQKNYLIFFPDNNSVHDVKIRATIDGKKSIESFKPHHRKNIILLLMDKIYL